MCMYVPSLLCQPWHPRGHRLLADTLASGHPKPTRYACSTHTLSLTHSLSLSVSLFLCFSLFLSLSPPPPPPPLPSPSPPPPPPPSLPPSLSLSLSLFLPFSRRHSPAIPLPASPIASSFPLRRIRSHRTCAGHPSPCHTSSSRANSARERGLKKELGTERASAHSQIDTSNMRWGALRLGREKRGRSILSPTLLSTDHTSRSRGKHYLQARRRLSVCGSSVSSSRVPAGLPRPLTALPQLHVVYTRRANGIARGSAERVLASRGGCSHHSNFRPGGDGHDPNGEREAHELPKRKSSWTLDTCQTLSNRRGDSRDNLLEADGNTS